MTTTHNTDNGFTVTTITWRDGSILHECATRPCTLAGQHNVDHACNPVICTAYIHKAIRA